jgi:hypothetical protein
MPFVSQQQRRFLYAKHPDIAKRWEAETPAKLPEHVVTPKAESVRREVVQQLRHGG